MNVLGFSVPAFVLVEGLITGLSYGLLALGLVLIYRTNRVLNFSQGQLGVVGAVFMVKLFYDFGIDYWAALAFALALAAAVGAVCELVLRRLFTRPRVLVMVATIGLAQVLYLFTVLPFVRPQKLTEPFPVPFHPSFTIDGFRFGPGQVITLVVAPLIAIGLAVFIRFSSWGLAMRATAENADSARLSGVWVRRTSTITWIIAALLSAATAILNAPGQTSSLTDVLSPDLLLLALTAALVGAMVNLPVAFLAGIAMGIIAEVLDFNFASTATVELILFAILLVILVVRVGTLTKGARTGERSSWELGAVTRKRIADRHRRLVRHGGVATTLVVAALLPLVLDIGHTYLMAQVCIFAVIALSLTVLTGWGGQVSLGQFGLVGVGAIVAARLGAHLPLVVLLVVGGMAGALVAVVVGLPALRVRGLYLAVSTLGFALLMQTTVLATSCWTVPLVHRQVCTGLPDPQSTLLGAPSLFGISLADQRTFAWFTLVVLVLSVLMVMVWRDRGIARRLVAVRDNETAAAAAGVPIVRTKILAFALSGFMAGYAGVCLAFADQRIGINTFDPAVSILVISMVVIGGLGSIPGAVLGALYLIGLPAIFGTTPTIQFITSGVGLLAFILYLPGGLAELASRVGDLVALGWDRWSGPTTPEPGGGEHDGEDGRSPEPAPEPAPEPERAGPAQPGTRGSDVAARLEARDLRVGFGGVQALDGVTLTAEPGTIVGLIGPNGSGKTTLLDAVSGIVALDDGTARLDDQDLAEYLPEERVELGVVRSFQDCALYPTLTVEDVLLLTTDARRPVSVLGTTLGLPGARRLEQAKRVEIEAVVGSLSLDRFRHHRISHLSTGTRRVVDLASVVLAGPRLLLLDEPTAGIAQREAEAFVPLLRQLQAVTGSTIVLVEHDVGLVFALCTQVVVMAAGAVVATGTPDQVKRDPAALAAYLGASQEALHVSGAATRLDPATDETTAAADAAPASMDAPHPDGGNQP